MFGCCYYRASAPSDTGLAQFTLSQCYTWSCTCWSISPGPVPGVLHGHVTGAEPEAAHLKLHFELVTWSCNWSISLGIAPICMTLLCAVSDTLSGVQINFSAELFLLQFDTGECLWR